MNAIVNDRAAAAKIRREAKVINVVERAFERRAHATQDPGVGGVGREVVGEVTPVELQQATQARDVRTVSGLNTKALLRRGAHDRRRRRGGLGGFLVQFELALENADLLFLGVQPRPQFGQLIRPGTDGGEAQHQADSPGQQTRIGRHKIPTCGR